MSEVQVYVPTLKDDGLKKAVKHLGVSGLLSGLIVKPLHVGRLEESWKGEKRSIDKHIMLESMLFGQIEPYRRPLFLGGTNSNHHLTYAVCMNLIEELGKDYTVVHFDKHEDGATRNPYLVDQTRDDMRRNMIHCGGFSDKLLADSQRANAVAMIDEYGNLTLNTNGYIEVVARDYGSYRLLEHARWFEDVDFSDRVVKTTYAKSDRKFFERLSKMIPTSHVYVTVDLDILWHAYMDTDCGHGSMELSFLLDGIGKVMKSREPLGADIYGLKSELSQSTFDYFSADGPKVGDFKEKVGRNLDTYGKVFARLVAGLSG